MALAAITPVGSDRQQQRFALDLGDNRWWKLVVGHGVTNHEGIPRVTDTVFTSSLLGPLPETANGRTTIGVPSTLFSSQHSQVQLLSYRSQDLSGPAVSDVVSVPLGDASDYHPTLPRTGSLDLVPRERRPVSSAMFLESLGPVFAGLEAAVGPILSLIGGLGGTPASRAPAREAEGLARLINRDTLHMIGELLEQFRRATGGAPAASSRTAPAPSPATAPSAATPSTPATEGGMALSLGTAYSQAQILPVLAALPALMPLLQSVLTPQTIQTLLQTADPSRLIGTVTQGLADLGKLGIQLHEADLEHLRALNPGVNDPALMQLMADDQSLAGDDTYRRVESVRLSLDALQLKPVHGRDQVLFHRGHDLVLRPVIATPQPIRGGTLQLQIRDAASGRVLDARRTSVDIGASGAMADVVVPAAAVAGLPLGADLQLVLTLTWSNRKRESIGTSLIQLATVVGDFLFDRVEEANDLVPLNDVEKHREFWHKVWQGTFSNDFGQANWTLKYYYRFDPAATANARLQTATDIEPDGWTRTGRMKSGLSLAPDALNRLLVAQGKQALPAEQLEALKTPDFVARFQRAARTEVRLHARPGGAGAIWVYPEMKMQKIVLKNVAGVAADGQVTALTEVPVVFPMPAMAHVIGAVSP